MRLNQFSAACNKRTTTTTEEKKGYVKETVTVLLEIYSISNSSMNARSNRYWLNSKIRLLSNRCWICAKCVVMWILCAARFRFCLFSHLFRPSWNLSILFAWYLALVWLNVYDSLVYSMSGHPDAFCNKLYQTHVHMSRFNCMRTIFAEENWMLMLFQCTN